MVDEVVVVFNSTNPGTSTPVSGADVVDYFSGCNAVRDCSGLCGCKRGDLLDFASLRNRSFGLATGDWIVWMDSDDIVEGLDSDNLRKLAAMSDRPIMFPYEYHYDDSGKCSMEIQLLRLTPRRGDFIWKQPIHEHLDTPGWDVNSYNRTRDVLWKHRRPDQNNSIKRNLRMALHWKDDAKYKKDARFLFYLGQSYSDSGKNEEAIEAYSRSFVLDNWDDQKYYSAKQICKAYMSQNKYFDAVPWAYKALAVHPDWPNGYFLLGEVYYHLHRQQGNNRWFAELSVRNFRIGLEMQKPNSVLPVDPDYGEFEIHKFYNVVLSAVGDVDGALKSCITALKTGRGDEDVRVNGLMYKAHLARERLETNLSDLLSTYDVGGVRADEYVRDTLGLLVKKLPSNLKTPELQSRAPVKTVALVCGHQWLSWTPLSGPPGGSEIAIVELSKRLAARGYDITVFASPTEGGIYDGVRWVPKPYPEETDEFDLLIGWRGLDRIGGGLAKRRVLWLHDMHVQFVTPERLSKIDVVAVNSEWHRDFIKPQLPGLRFEVLGAGLDPKRFQAAATRNLHRCVWASSPVRGLDFMVSIWPSVRREVGDASLDVMYGFETSLNMYRKENNQAAIAKIETMQKICEETPGVILHGRVSDEKYPEVLLGAGVWAYPSSESNNTFSETFCVSAVESICSGLRVVCTPSGALAEVASPSAFRQVYGPRDAPGYREKFIKAIIEAMTEPEDDSRHLLAEAAKIRFDWDRVVDRWEERILK
jgi:glycosyltransferase involved in cell wall biosynthesis/tetratricopeptide (TPR) repeat protein